MSKNKNTKYIFFLLIAMFLVYVQGTQHVDFNQQKFMKKAVLGEDGQIRVTFVKMQNYGSNAGNQMENKDQILRVRKSGERPGYSNFLDATYFSHGNPDRNQGPYQERKNYGQSNRREVKEQPIYGNLRSQQSEYRHQDYLNAETAQDIPYETHIPITVNPSENDYPTIQRDQIPPVSNHDKYQNIEEENKVVSSHRNIQQENNDIIEHQNDEVKEDIHHYTYAPVVASPSINNSPIIKGYSSPKVQQQKNDYWNYGEQKNDIKGYYNLIKGRDNKIEGNKNYVTVQSEENQIYGHGNYVQGSGNVIHS